ncbi:MAG: TonB-dependent receptor, partial [Sphingopyxis sp.]
DRGLGQASQNVLVNGHRVSGKSNDARRTLQQIAAQSVIRIEILDGARTGIAGLTGKVANVVVSSGQVQVQFRWEGQNRRNIPDQITSGSISASGRMGATDFTLSLSNNGGRRRGGVGPEIVTSASGAVLLTRQERDVFSEDQPRLAGTLHREWADGSTLNLNASGELYYYRGNFNALATPADGSANIRESYRQTEDEWNAEAGGDYEWAVGNGRLKIIALQRFEHSPFSSVYHETPQIAGGITTGSQFNRVADEGESVLRAEYSWANDWQVSVEAAYNFLEITSEFGRLQPDGSYTNIALSGADTFVDEWRGEALVTRGWTLAPSLTVQTSLGAEYSRIRQTSANGLSRSFLRPKGSVALTWTATPRITVNASIQRDVGQLSFYDFSAAVDLRNGAASAGNTSLVPEQLWRAKMEIGRTLGAAGSITLGAYHEWISDIVDRIPIGTTQEGVGNLPSARRWGATARGTLLLDALGWHGGRINANGTFNRSLVRDPLTGINRRISDDLVREWSAELRHDIPRTSIAWGAAMAEERSGAIYRLDQLSSAWLNHPIASAYIEHKNVLGMTVRATLRNLMNAHDDIRRTVYVARRDGAVDYQERQTRHIYLIGILTISGRF